MAKGALDTKKILNLLDGILEMELASVVRYTHYSFMIFGHNRIPIVAWLRSQAKESHGHACEAGEMITHFGGHPSLAIGPLLETHNHNVDFILREAHAHETAALNLYKSLLAAAEGHSVFLEEYARKMIAAEEAHVGEVDKMLRKPLASGSGKKSR